MLIFGHRFIAFKPFYHIDSIEAIVHTAPGSVLFIPFDESSLDIVAYFSRNDLPFALGVSSVLELVLAENLGASYLIVNESIAKSAQKIAETYLFDAKVLCRIDEEILIETLAHEGIDGVIFPEAIVKVTA